jgi:hypothetical protein
VDRRVVAAVVAEAVDGDPDALSRLQPLPVRGRLNARANKTRKT